MADFETSGSVVIEVDQSSLRDSRRKVEQSIGSVTVDVDGGGVGAGPAGGRDAMGGLTQSMETGLDLDEERNEILLDMIDEIEEAGGLMGGGGGDGGGDGPFGFDLPSLGLGALGSGLLGRLGLGRLGLGGLGPILGGAGGLTISGLLEDAGALDAFEGLPGTEWAPFADVNAALGDFGQAFNNLLTGNFDDILPELEEGALSGLGVWQERLGSLSGVFSGGIADILGDVGDLVAGGQSEGDRLNSLMGVAESPFEVLPFVNDPLTGLYDYDDDGAQTRSNPWASPGQSLDFATGSTAFDLVSDMTGIFDSSPSAGLVGQRHPDTGRQQHQLLYGTGQGGMHPSESGVDVELQTDVTIDDVSAMQGDLQRELERLLPGLVDDIIAAVANDPRLADRLSEQQHDIAQRFM